MCLAIVEMAAAVEDESSVAAGLLAGGRGGGMESPRPTCGPWKEEAFC